MKINDKEEVEKSHKTLVHMNICCFDKFVLCFMRFFEPLLYFHTFDVGRILYKGTEVCHLKLHYHPQGLINYFCCIVLDQHSFNAHCSILRQMSYASQIHIHWSPGTSLGLQILNKRQNACLMVIPYISYDQAVLYECASHNMYVCMYQFAT